MRWNAVDERSANATLVDGPITLTLLVRFDDAGLIESFRAGVRGGIAGFRTRRPHLEMVAAVANTRPCCRQEPDGGGGDRGAHIAVIEAGTGTGESFGAPQFRVLFTAAAFVILQQLRLRLARVAHDRPPTGTMRLRLLEIAVRIESSARRVVMHFVAPHDWAKRWLLLARSCGAAPT